MKFNIRRGRLISFLLSSSLVLTVPVLAKDFLREVCIGFVAPDSPTPPKTVETLALVYDDHRSGADKRKITVSISQAGGNRIYQGTNISDGIVTSLKIANVDDPKDVLFDGTVEYVNGGIEIAGRYFTAGNPKGMIIKTALVGYEIP